MNVLKRIDKNLFSLFFQKNNLICLSVVIFTFILDRISKIQIIDYSLDNNLVYINDFINFELIWNTGIGFGFFKSNSEFIYNLTTTLIGFVLIFIIYLIIKSKLFDKILFSLILGGALGNFYDRLIYFAVPDFIDVHYERFHWFTFNIADIFITIGIILLVIKDLFLQNEKN